jgi:tetratricopeptide (TPR) repeat protein
MNPVQASFRPRTVLPLVLSAIITLVAGCDSSPDRPMAAVAPASGNAPSAGGRAAGATLTAGEIAVPQPDATTAEPAVQTRLRERRMAFDASLATNTAPTRRAEAWGQLGLFYFAYQFSAHAASCFTNAVFHAPADHRAWYGLAECLAEDDHYEDAITAMETALRQMDGVPTATLADQNSARRFLGDALERLGRIPEALLQFETVLVFDRNDTYSQARAGQLHALNGGGAAALEYLENAQRRAPKNQTLRSLLAQEYRRNGQPERAAALNSTLQPGAAQASPLVRPDPWRHFAAGLVESPTMLVRRANRLAQRGQPLKAVAAYEAALRLDPTNNAAGINLANTLLAARRPLEARRVIEEVAARGDTSEELRYNLAAIRGVTGATNEAMQVVEQWRRERPNEPLALQLESVVREQAGDLAGARVALERYLTLKPGAAPMAVRLARLQARIGNPAAARSTLQTALAQAPGNPPLQHELARLLALNPQADIRDPARAVELLRPLLSAKPGLPQIETVILALHASGDREAAADRFTRLTHSLAKRTNAGLVARLERLRAVLASPKPVEEPWPFALNAGPLDPEEPDANKLPTKTP